MFRHSNNYNLYTDTFDIYDTLRNWSHWLCQHWKNQQGNPRGIFLGRNLLLEDNRNGFERFSDSIQWMALWNSANQKLLRKELFGNVPEVICFTWDMDRWKTIFDSTMIPKTTIFLINRNIFNNRLKINWFVIMFENDDFLFGIHCDFEFSIKSFRIRVNVIWIVMNKDIKWIFIWPLLTFFLQGQISIEFVPTFTSKSEIFPAF